MTDRDVSRPLPIVRIERPSAERGADAVREHLDGERCVFCDVPADGREKLDVFGNERHLPTCGGCPDCPTAAFWQLDEQAERRRFCPECGAVVLADELSTYDVEMCHGCSAFRCGEFPWYLSNDRIEAVIEAAEAAGETPDARRQPL